MYISSIERIRTTAKLLTALSPKMPQLDWFILDLLNEAKKPVSFNHIYKNFFTEKPTYLNGRYYKAIDRLITKNLVKQTFTPKGWRQWEITLSGIKTLNRANRELTAQLSLIPGD